MPRQSNSLLYSAEHIHLQTNNLAGKLIRLIQWKLSPFVFDS